MGAVTTSASPAKAQNRPPSRRPPPHPQWYPLAPPHWRPVARPAGALWPMGYRREPLLSLAQGGDLGAPLCGGPTTGPTALWATRATAVARSGTIAGSTASGSPFRGSGMSVTQGRLPGLSTAHGNGWSG